MNLNLWQVFLCLGVGFIMGAAAALGYVVVTSVNEAKKRSAKASEMLSDALETFFKEASKEVSKPNKSRKKKEVTSE